MAVSPSYKAFVLEQLGLVAPVTSRSLFGGVGIYGGGLFFALIDDDTLYFKVDDSSRRAYVEAGMRAFDPFKNGKTMEGYYEVPGEALEDEDRLAEWMREALAVASRAKAPARKPRKRT